MKTQLLQLQDDLMWRKCKHYRAVNISLVDASGGMEFEAVAEEQGGLLVAAQRVWVQQWRARLNFGQHRAAIQ